jgi:1-acyl-sn-glycerol-3-phosphate acyltransferase
MLKFREALSCSRAILAFMAAVVLTGVVCIFLAFAILDRDGESQSRALRLWSRATLWLAGVTIEIGGIENIDQQQVHVYAANHTSLLDILIVLAGIPGDFRLVADSTFFIVPLMGRNLQRVGHISVPKRDVYGRAKAVKRAIDTLRHKSFSLVICPEGRLSGGQLERFQDGIAYVALRSGVSIIPTAIMGTDRALPKGKHLIRNGRVSLLFGSEITLGNYSSNMKIETYTRCIWDAVRTLIELATTNQIPPSEER